MLIDFLVGAIVLLLLVIAVLIYVIVKDVKSVTEFVNSIKTVTKPITDLLGPILSKLKKPSAPAK